MEKSISILAAAGVIITLTAFFAFSNPGDFTGQLLGTQDDIPDLPSRMKAAYTYYPLTNLDIIQYLKDQGFNAIIIKNSLPNSVNYSDYPDQLPDAVKDYANWSKMTGMQYFQALNFVHRVPSEFSDKNVVYSDGSMGTHVSPYDKDYWDHLTDLVVALARLPVNYPDTYRIDGVWFDFELYGNPDLGEPRLITRDWGFEDSTFNSYLENRSLAGWNDPPVSPDKRDMRYSWLAENGKTEDYYLFLRDTLEGYAENMKAEVRKCNPDFLIGAYDATVYEFGHSILDGWSNETDPAVVWATESYTGGGAERIPGELAGSKTSQGYYNLSKVYGSFGQEIYGYYFGGMIIRRYSVTNFAYHLFNVAKESNGYWLWTTWPLTSDYDYLLGKYPGYLILCLNSTSNMMRSCNDEAEYTKSTADYFANISLGNSEIDKLETDENYETYIIEQPDPVIFIDPITQSIDHRPVRPLENKSKIMSLYDSRIVLRGEGVFVIYAQAGKNVTINLTGRRIGSYPYGVACILKNMTGMIEKHYIMHDMTETISFMAPYTGLYELHAFAEQNGFYISGTNVPVMIYSKKKMDLFIPSLNISFWVNGSTDHFQVNASGAGGREGASARILMPFGSGYAQILNDSTTETKHNLVFDVMVPADARNKIWKIEIYEPLPYDSCAHITDPAQKRRCDPILEDIKVTFDGNIIPYFGLTDDHGYFLATYFCGDGIIDDAESCDTDNITQTCQSLGYDSGEVSCTQDCEIDTSKCTNKDTSPPRKKKKSSSLLTGCAHGENRSCGSDTGICKTGTQTCAYGIWGECSGGIGPLPEICNGMDDDCNGEVDDGIVCDCINGRTRECGLETGACIPGFRICVGGRWSVECYNETGPSDEVCANGIDEDCDGLTDEECCLETASVECPEGAIHAKCLCEGRTYTSGYCHNDYYFEADPVPGFPWEVLTFLGGIILCSVFLFFAVRELHHFSKVHRAIRPDERKHIKSKFPKAKEVLWVNDITRNPAKYLGKTVSLGGYIKLSKKKSDNDYWYSIYDSVSTFALHSARSLKEGYIEIKVIIKKTQLGYIYADA